MRLLGSTSVHHLTTDASPQWIPELQQYAKGIPFVLVASKTDLRNDQTALTPKFAVIDAASSGDNTILAAVATNTIGKVVIGAVVGRGRFAAEIAALGLACLLAGGAVLWAVLALLAA